MNEQTSWPTGRRRFMREMGVLGASAVLGIRPADAAAEAPPEVTRIRIHDAPLTCFAPIYLAEALLKAEGFTEIQYVKTPAAEGPTRSLAAGVIDIAQNDTAGHLMELEKGGPVVILGGIHTGCWELFGNPSVRT